jgi:hypothetical protein
MIDLVTNKILKTLTILIIFLFHNLVLINNKKLF